MKRTIVLFKGQVTRLKRQFGDQLKFLNIKETEDSQNNVSESTPTIEDHLFKISMLENLEVQDQ